MADEFSFSYSYAGSASTSAPQAAAPSPDSERYAFARCDTIPVDASSVLVIARHSGRQMLLAPQAVAALAACCTVFRTVEEHAQVLVAQRPELGGNLDNARAVLQQLADDALLLPASAVCARLNAAPAAQAGSTGASGPTRVFIITCDRPAAVERLLDSLLRAGQLSRHERLFLIDDSRDSACAAANAAAVESFNLRSARDMHYVGERAQQALLQGLLEALPEHAAGTRFLLDRAQWPQAATYGRARTLCLLLSVGARAIVLDDDILCQALLPPLQDAGTPDGGDLSPVDLSLYGDREAAFFADPQSLLRQAQAAPQDPLGGHASLLGARVGEALHALNAGQAVRPGQLQEGDAAALALFGPDSRILVTQCGTLGDPGTLDPHWVLDLGPTSIQRLIASPQGVPGAMQNRCHWIGTRRPQLLKSAYLSQMTGLDNRALLPPYFPAYRGEDQLFGAMVEALHHDSAVLEYPWAVPHLPLEPRGGEGLRAPVAGTGGMSLLARQLVRLIDTTDPVRPQAQLVAIAQAARRLTARTEETLLLDYRRELAALHAEQLQALRTQQALAQQLGSAAWSRYVQRAVEETQHALMHAQHPGRAAGKAAGSAAPGPDGTVTGTADAQHSDSAARQQATQLRQLAAGWADALDAWCALRDWAAEHADRCVQG